MTGPAILVFGAIHGDEAAGIAIARDLLADAPRLRSNIWVVPDLNPDGVAKGTRQNAHGVDLNRNFPWRWHPAGQQGDLHYSGRRVLSEPESRFATALITRLHPSITIWFHQPLALVDESGGSLLVERRFARRVGLPIHRLPRYRGSATTWQNHRFPATTAFVVELPRRSLPDTMVERFAHAVEVAALVPHDGPDSSPAPAASRVVHGLSWTDPASRKSGGGEEGDEKCGQRHAARGLVRSVEEDRDFRIDRADGHRDRDDEERASSPIDPTPC